ncbi:hypothetical protein NHX12_012764 [Muraenolepis orangiensis]|uniref:BHLH domain-containing protein n=1 Tax=Muraenolepis orangiensis TaxID=630683 RepID=A0A9Q0DD29_9TELE|nr:hypothetical protein NHX12_012764 [Muraenolepis orangiensis]
MSATHGDMMSLLEMTEVEYDLFQTGRGPDHDGSIHFRMQPTAASFQRHPTTTRAVDLSTSAGEEDPRPSDAVDVRQLDVGVGPSGDGGGQSGEKTPSTGGEVPGWVLTRAQQELVRVDKKALPAAPVKGPRARIPRVSAVDPRLEGTRAAVAAGRSVGTRASAAESSQRREKHNSKERERRKRIRMCCNELNSLVPFCKPETDKATALLWTTVFLKHLQELYGNSLKENFQSSIFGQTDPDRLHQEMAAGTASCLLVEEQGG